jgi:hypothetical protein
MMPSSKLLYRPHELAFRTQYAELKERARSTAAMLPGTPGTLVKRTGTGRAYWYRVYRTASGAQVEDLVCKDGDEEALRNARAGLDFAQWTAAQVRNLRKLDFQVADKGVASVLVELHNAGLLAAGVVVVGTLGYMAWLNELGARAVSARTQDIDLAARQRLKLAAPQSFLQTVQATRLGFVPVPGLPNKAQATSVKLSGRDGLRVDVLAHGEHLGATVPVPQLMWHAQTVPHYDYLLSRPREAAILAGGHCIPVWLPQPERLVWHKLYSSASRQSFPEKADKDLLQAGTLAAVLTEQEDQPLSDSLDDVPPAMKQVLRKRLPAARRVLSGHDRALEALERALA